MSNNRVHKKSTRTIFERIQVLFDVLAAQDDYISITQLSKATGLSTSAIKSQIQRINYIQSQPAIHVRTEGHRTFLKLDLDEKRV